MKDICKFSSNLSAKFLSLYYILYSFPPPHPSVSVIMYYNVKTFISMESIIFQRSKCLHWGHPRKKTIINVHPFTIQVYFVCLNKSIKVSSFKQHDIRLFVKWITIRHLLKLSKFEIDFTCQKYILKSIWYVSMVCIFWVLSRMFHI